MEFDFQSLIKTLNADVKANGNFAFAMAKARVVPNDFLFVSTILPFRFKPTYDINAGSIRVYPTPAQLTPMDTPYRPIGFMEASVMKENTAKFTGMMHFPEKTLRDLREMEKELALVSMTGGGGGGDRIKEGRLNALLNFSEMLLYSQWANYELMAGEVLTEGLINMTGVGGVVLTVDYGIPSGNIITRAGADSYYNTTSKFWTDIRAVYAKLRNPTFIMNNNTYLSIIDNEENSVQVIVNEGNTREIMFWNSEQVRPRTDARERVRIVIYDKSISLLDANADKVTVPALKDGRIIAVGEQAADGFELTQGSVEDPERMWELGYTHIAPTEEGGQSGFFQKIYTPEAEDYMVIGKTASNGLSVITNENRLVILKTGMPS